MKKYILNIVGNFSNQSNLNEVLVSLEPIVDSPNMKFRFSENLLIIHFATEVCKDELFHFIKGILYEISEIFVLTEINDKYCYSFPKEFEKSLLDLENSNDDDFNYDEIYYHEEVDDELVKLFVNEIKHIKKPTLDIILDKINDKGLQSLTEYEKDTLDFYSKNTN